MARICEKHFAVSINVLHNLLRFAIFLQLVKNDNGPKPDFLTVGFLLDPPIATMKDDSCVSLDLIEHIIFQAANCVVQGVSD